MNPQPNNKQSNLTCPREPKKSWWCRGEQKKKAAVNNKEQREEIPQLFTKEPTKHESRGGGLFSLSPNPSAPSMIPLPTIPSITLPPLKPTTSTALQTTERSKSKAKEKKEKKKPPQKYILSLQTNSPQPVLLPLNNFKPIHAFFMENK